MALTLAAACGGAGAGGAATPTAPPPTPAPTATVPQVIVAGDPGLSVTSLIQACRSKDAEEVRALLSVEAPDGELQALFARGDDVQLLRQSVPNELDGQVEVTVLLRIQRDSGIEDEERTWELERTEEGIWLFTELPDCY
ncbi:MAG: hypothetical protein WD939_00675 [Dehalococcoidia bacterium]